MFVRSQYLDAGDFKSTVALDQFRDTVFANLSLPYATGQQSVSRQKNCDPLKYRRPLSWG